MEIIENWADIRGHIVNLLEHSRLKGFVSAQIQVTHVSPVAGFANMFEAVVGQTISVNIPRLIAERFSLRPGSVVTCRIRKGGPEALFLHPDILSVETA